MAIKRIKLEDIEKSKGTTNKNTVDNMTEADIKRGILSDKDSPNLSDGDLNQFKSVPKGGENEEG